ncbi:hydroxyacid dehydrogenase [Clostridium sp. 19966]|uniref:NAD(P)-dependent oxidoreductase n=1 Tax=Clostridium sp. 19966 TaxID=2768166 RepID=UPI0028DDDDD7|nr:NAD(P)-dependent oxidoreductase [Clostridium sp. 19966]MDT8716183.1 hydroxyacid dehydrogenase [Clostridium sp. 19966]
MNIVMLEPIGVAGKVLDHLTAFLTEKGHKFIPYFERNDDVDVLKSRVKDADVLIIANMPLKGEVIRAAENLKFISVAFTGIDHIDLEVCKEKNIIIKNAAGYSTNSVAEVAIGLMIDVMRNIVPLDKLTREGGTKAGYSQRELFGKTLGIVGTGAIGIKTAEIASAFGMNIIAYSKTKKSEVINKGIKYVELNELLENSDIVSLHVPFTAETKQLINGKNIAKMKPSAVLINTARGGVVDNEALAKALSEGKIAGAGVDVFDMEPPIPEDYPLLKAPNAVFTPHIAFAAEEAILRRADIVFDNIRDYLK